ncbi:MAG: DUF4386 domain-containing protein [Anaerolineae bacterium]|nr:DUF4386 domain-containing protein [Anaerolineae bacterium]
MISNTSYRGTAVIAATLWLLTAFGAIAGTALMNGVLDAPDYLMLTSSQSTTVIGGMLLWLVNDFGIVMIGLVMFPILKQQSERLALAYLSMRIFESIFLIVGVIFALLVIPLSQAYIKAGAVDAASYQAIGIGLRQAQYWFMTPLQLIPLGLGGLVLTILLYRARLVPRLISLVGIIGYAVLLPAGILTLLGVLDTLPGQPGSVLVIPVAVFEIILMPVWLYAKGFNFSAGASRLTKSAANSALGVA